MLEQETQLISKDNQIQNYKKTIEEFKEREIKLKSLSTDQYTTQLEKENQELKARIEQIINVETQNLDKMITEDEQKLEREKDFGPMKAVFTQKIKSLLQQNMALKTQLDDYNMMKSAFQSKKEEWKLINNHENVEMMWTLMINYLQQNFINQKRYLPDRKFRTRNIFKPFKLKNILQDDNNDNILF